MDIKCVCGYHYQKDIIEEKVIKGDEPFIPLVEDIKIDRLAYLVIFAHRIGNQTKRYQLVMCPKCFTIKGERYL